MENTSYPIFLIFRLACLLLCALNYWHLTCGFVSYSLLPPINKEWGSISGLKCKSVWTMLHQFHPLRNADNFRTPRLILLQKHCSVICLTFAKALVLIHTGAKNLITTGRWGCPGVPGGSTTEPALQQCRCCAATPPTAPAVLYQLLFPGHHSVLDEKIPSPGSAGIWSCAVCLCTTETPSHLSM